MAAKLGHNILDSITLNFSIVYFTIIALSATLSVFDYFAVAETTRPSNPSLEVVSDIFLKQDGTGAVNEAHYYSIIEAATGLGNNAGQFHGQAHISTSFVCVLQTKTKMSITFSPFEGGGGGGFQMGHIVPMTTMTTSLPQHRNHYPTGSDGNRCSVDQDCVAFVVLNMNPDAYFVMKIWWYPLWGEVWSILLVVFHGKKRLR